VVDYERGATVLTGPLVLGRIGAEVLAVNAVLDDGRANPTQDEVDERLEEVSALAGSSGADVGAILDTTGERLRLVDGKGRPVPVDRALLAFVDLVSRDAGRPRVAVPVTTSRVVEDLLEERGGEVIWTRVSPSALSAAALEPGVILAGAEGGGYMFPEFLPAYDAVMSLVKLLELLARAEQRLEDVVDALPPSNVIRVDVATPWESRGTVMRRLVERLNGEKIVTIDGVKAFRGRDWALVIPHPQEPVVRVWAEADDADGSRAMAAEFAALVEELRG
jgi:mannose-1-phosphate guanylyltransferase/phosphomannomutase